MCIRDRASCFALFVFPLMLLGTVTPSLMKYATESLDDNGRTVGELEALGTIGSCLLYTSRRV